MKCPTCGSAGFDQSILGPNRCEFCDGSFSGNPDLGKDFADKARYRAKTLTLADIEKMKDEIRDEYNKAKSYLPAYYMVKAQSHDALINGLGLQDLVKYHSEVDAISPAPWTSILGFPVIIDPKMPHDEVKIVNPESRKVMTFSMKDLK